MDPYKVYLGPDTRCSSFTMVDGRTDCILWPGHPLPHRGLPYGQGKRLRSRAWVKTYEEQRWLDEGRSAEMRQI